MPKIKTINLEIEGKMFPVSVHFNEKRLFHVSAPRDCPLSFDSIRAETIKAAISKVEDLVKNRNESTSEVRPVFAVNVRTPNPRSQGGNLSIWSNLSECAGIVLEFQEAILVKRGSLGEIYESNGSIRGPLIDTVENQPYIDRDEDADLTLRRIKASLDQISLSVSRLILEGKLKEALDYLYPIVDILPKTNKQDQKS